MKINRKEVFNKYDGHCAYCGCDIKASAFEIDHFDPRRRWDVDKGGDDSIENLMPACRRCNRQKNSLSIKSFRWLIENKVTILNRDTTAYETAKRYGLVKETNIKVVFYFEKN